MWSPATREPRAASARDYDVLKYGTLLCVLFRSYAELHVTDSPCAALLYPLQQHMCWRRGNGAGANAVAVEEVSLALRDVEVVRTGRVSAAFDGVHDVGQQLAHTHLLKVRGRVRVRVEVEW